MKTVAMNAFVRRQTPDSEFSHYEGSEADLVELVEANLDKGVRGYRDGVLLVPVPAEGFYSAVRTLREGDLLRGEYKARREGETPRKHIGYDTPPVGYDAASMRARRNCKTPAQSVEIVLYAHAVLAEDDDASTDADYEIVSINASPTGEMNMPMDPDTFMANHFGASGGTDTQMSDSEFVAELRRCYEFWKDKALL